MICTNIFDIVPLHDQVICSFEDIMVNKVISVTISGGIHYHSIVNALVENKTI